MDRLLKFGCTEFRSITCLTNLGKGQHLNSDVSLLVVTEYRLCNMLDRPDDSDLVVPGISKI